MQVKSRLHEVICFISILNPASTVSKIPHLAQWSPPDQIHQIKFSSQTFLVFILVPFLYKPNSFPHIHVLILSDFVPNFLPSFSHVTHDTDFVCYTFNSKLASADTICFQDTSPQDSALIVHKMAKVNNAKRQANLVSQEEVKHFHWECKKWYYWKF